MMHLAFRVKFSICKWRRTAACILGPGEKIALKQMHKNHAVAAQTKLRVLHAQTYYEVSFTSLRCRHKSIACSYASSITCAGQIESDESLFCTCPFAPMPSTI